MRLWILALAAAAAPVIAAPAAAGDMYYMTGAFEITVTPASGCASVVVSAPTAFSGPAVNHGQTVGPITYTSDIPCATPPSVALTAGSVFVLDADTLPANLKFGPSDVVAGTYSATGNAVTVGEASQTVHLKGLMLPAPPQ